MLNHHSIGQGNNVVIAIHDWMGDHRNYEPAMPYLDTERTRWILPDLRGYGGSQALPGACTLEEAAQDILDLAASLGLERFDLVGHSMSSLVAQQIAAQAPEKIRRLALVCPVSPAGMGTPDEVVSWLEAVAEDPTHAGMAAAFASRLGEQWASFKLQRWASAARPEAARKYVRMFSRQSVIGDLPAGLPVLAIVGDADAEPFTEQTVRKSLGAAWHNLTVAVLADVGHYPMQEAPPAFAAALTRFLAP